MPFDGQPLTDAARVFGTLADSRFGALFADPPWRYATWSEAGRYGRGPDRHYPTMTEQDICNLPVASLAATDCGLVMFATWPMLPTAMRVMEAWGFKYVTGGSWLKLDASGRPKIGTGYRVRSVCEPFLIGKRGRPKTGRVKPSNHIKTPVREHSRKPDEAYRFTEQLFGGPYLELFSRALRDDWAAWGNDVGRFP